MGRPAGPERRGCVGAAAAAQLCCAARAAGACGEQQRQAASSKQRSTIHATAAGSTPAWMRPAAAAEVAAHRPRGTALLPAAGESS
jgi:hypothetical protein